MKLELEQSVADYQQEVVTTVIDNELNPITAGRGQCLVRGCLCKGFKGLFLCDTCGHETKDHQD